MRTFVIYEENGDYKFTGEDNYLAKIPDINRITTFKTSDGFRCAKDVLDYVCNYAKHLKPSDIKVLTESSTNDRSESRFNGLVDQIDIIANMISDTGSMSTDQQSQLADLRDQVSAFGERGAKWASMCDEIIGQYSPKMESMMEFYASFVSGFDCPPVLAEAALRSFKEVLLEASTSSSVAEELRQRVGINPNETRGVGVFGISGDDNLPQQTTIDNEIADSMAAGTFDALGDDISTVDPNNADETTMGLGSSEAETFGNDLNPDDWAAPVDEEPIPETDASVEAENHTDSTVDDGINPNNAFESIESMPQTDSVAKIKRYMTDGRESAANTVQMLLLGGNYEDCRLSMHTAREYLFDRKHLLGDDVTDSDVPALPLARRAIYDLVDSLDGSDKTSLLSDIIEYAASHGSMDELDTLEQYLN